MPASARGALRLSLRSRDDLRPKSRALRPGWPPKRACGRSASIVPYRAQTAILLRFPRHQPFTAPTVRPEMKYFWKNGYAQAMGTTMTVAMAMRTDSDGIWLRYCCRLRPAVGLLAR